MLTFWELQKVRRVANELRHIVNWRVFVQVECDPIGSFWGIDHFTRREVIVDVFNYKILNIIAQLNFFFWAKSRKKIFWPKNMVRDEPFVKKIESLILR